MSVWVEPKINRITICCLEGKCSYKNSAGDVEMTSGQKIISSDTNAVPPIEKMDQADVQSWLDNSPESAPIVAQISGLVVSSTPGASSTPQASSTNLISVPTMTPTPSSTSKPQGPFVVKQIRSQGGETISGEVCSITDTFGVTFKTPSVTFITQFVPQNASAGNLSYAYSLPKAGETHDATGTYTLSLAGADGTLLLSMKVSDHVVSNGYDGTIPINYEFNLVPSSHTSCPASR